MEAMEKPQTRDLRPQSVPRHTSKDRENFGEPWDQARITQRTTTFHQKIQSVFLGLTAGGLMLKITEPELILSEMLILFGGLLGAIATINILRRKRASC